MKTPQQPPTIGACILTGGENRRMQGRHKATLTWGGKTFLARTVEALSGFSEVLLSVAKPGDDFGTGLPTAPDNYPGQGPLAGLQAALSACKSDALFFASCDMPLLAGGLAEFLASYFCDEYDVVIPETRDGGLHPLCGVYSKRVAPIFEAQLQAGDNKIRNAFSQMRVKTVRLDHSAYPDEMLSNVNTPAEYHALSRHINGPPVISVCGVKNSGKTTLLEGVIPHLVRAGLEVAVIKHDAHDFEPDVPATDSYRLRMAGASNVAVYSDLHYMLAGEWERHPRGNPALNDSELPEKHARLLPWFQKADLVLLEGGKALDLPKIEVLRAAVGNMPVCAPEEQILLCTDTDTRPAGVPVADIADYAAIARVILDYIGLGGPQ